MQPRAFSAKKRLTRRSSSEWKVSAAMRPPIFVTLQASGSASSSWVSSPLTAIRMAWKVRLAGWPPAKRAGAGIAAAIASLSSKVVVELLAAAAADDLARDPVREALLAVLAQRARDPAAVPRVDDLERRELLARVHAHVERGVVGVREAALAVVDLHRAHAEVHVDEVGAHALLDQLLQGR